MKFNFKRGIVWRFIINFFIKCVIVTFRFQLDGEIFTISPFRVSEGESKLTQGLAIASGVGRVSGFSPGKAVALNVVRTGGRLARFTRCGVR